MSRQKRIGSVEEKPASTAVEVLVAEYGLRWRSWGRNGRMQTHEKFFVSDAARARFAAKLSERESFIEFVAWSDPKHSLH